MSAADASSDVETIRQERDLAWACLDALETILFGDNMRRSRDELERRAEELAARENVTEAAEIRWDEIVAALDLGLQAWRTVPSARERFIEAIAQVGRLRAALDKAGDGE